MLPKHPNNSAQRPEQASSQSQSPPGEPYRDRPHAMENLVNKQTNGPLPPSNPAPKPPGYYPIPSGDRQSPITGASSTLSSNLGPANPAQYTYGRYSYPAHTPYQQPSIVGYQSQNVQNFQGYSNLQPLHATGLPYPSNPPSTSAQTGAPVRTHNLQYDTPSVSSASQASSEAAARHVAKDAVPERAPKKSPETPADASRTKFNTVRKRSSTACDKCRQKKIKCDNIRPRCGSCARNGISDCHYTGDNGAFDQILPDEAYQELSSKLDSIMREIKRVQPSAHENLEPVAPKQAVSKLQVKEKPQWDASFTQFLKWPYFQRVLGIEGENVVHHIDRVLAFSEESNIMPLSFGSVQLQFSACAEIEAIFDRSFSAHINAFLINSHTKIPFLDIVQLFESLEVYSLIRKADVRVTPVTLLEEYYALKSTQRVGEKYIRGLASSGVEDSAMLQNAYRVLCETVPIILMVCAIGVISAPVSLDNIGNYRDSLEERSSQGPQKMYGPDTLRPDRFALSQKYINYIRMVIAMFPQALRPNSIKWVQYRVLLSQYYHYTLNPSMAYQEIVSAGNCLVYYIEKTDSRKRLQLSNQPDNFVDHALMNRLYWTCLKLECELRVEYSPHVPLSPITSITPVSSFFKIPEPAKEHEHTRNSIHIASKYDDQNTWYYFLTEIAVRKVDNNMLDDIYPFKMGHLAWADPQFANDKVWKYAIKYSNQINGIVDSLTPAIRRFVLSETDQAQIYASIKRKAHKRRKHSAAEDDLPQVLDDFLVDEDLLHQAQSESVMFIKTRILASRVLLIRPLLYLYLHDQIGFDEIMEAAAAALAHTQAHQPEQEMTDYQADSADEDGSQSNSTRSEGSIYSSAAALNLLDGNGDNCISASLSGLHRDYTRKARLDDFSDLVEFSESTGENEDGFTYAKRCAAARKRILTWFVHGLVSIPKLNIPKIGSFRHPGSWYYIRNLMMTVIQFFLLYKKTVDHAMREAPSLKHANVFQAIFRKDHVQQTLEHAILIADYWKAERKDCIIYGEYLRQCLDRL